MSDDERTTHWYYRVGGRETGPVLFGRLRQLARQGEIVAEDKVRKGKMGEWVVAGSIDGLGAQPRAHSVVAPAAQGTEKNHPLDEPETMIERGSSFWAGLKYWWYDALQSVADRLWILRRVAAVVVLLLVVVALVRMTLRRDLFDWSAPADPFTTYNLLWDEIKQKRAAHADDEEWAELAERGKREVAPIVARLENLASAQNRSAQLLLWAGRDCLPQMLVDARTAPSLSERRFEEYLGDADRLRQGQPIKGYNPADGHGLVQSTLNSLARDPLEAAMWIVMIPVDAGILIWVAMMWRRRRA